MTEPVILILRPSKHWGIVTAELKRVASLGRFMIVKGAVLNYQLDDAQPELLRLITLCEEIQPGRLYVRHANKKVFRHEADFWATTDATIRQHIKRMADKRLAEAVRLASALSVPILYAATDKTPLHIEDQLLLQTDTAVTPVMHFSRNDSGISYRLQLCLGGQSVVVPSEHSIAVLGHEPGMFVFDSQLLMLGEGFSGKLLLPFVTKTVVEIPQHMENEYFRRFILKNVAKADITAEGFDIVDIDEPLLPRLTLEQAVDGCHLLSLSFLYGDTAYMPDMQTKGRVTLRETDGGFRFTRQLRDKQQEQHYADLLSQTGTVPLVNGFMKFPSLDALVEWLRQYGPQLRRQGFDVVQPSDHVYYIGPLSVEQSDQWNGDWLQTDVTIVLDNGRLRIPFSALRDTILRGDQDFMLPTGERLLIPVEWLSRYSRLLFSATTKDGAFRRHRSQLPPGTTVPSPDTPVSSPNTPIASPEKLHATLRPYQLTGYQWLWRNFEARTGCCLSDEMGLGKTLQTIALLLMYKQVAYAPKPSPQPGFLFTEEEMSGTIDNLQCSIFNPQSSMFNAQCSMFNVQCSMFNVQYKTSLVIAPASVVHNWHSELQRFAPSLTVCNYTGDTAKRRTMRQKLMQWDVVLTTYRTLVNDIDCFADLLFGVIVFDESQAFKTSTSQVHKAVSCLQSIHRMALSGTPVENNLDELWSLMNVLNPNLLGDSRSFQQNFVQPIARQMEEERTEVLRRLIAPYFMKRTKEQVLDDLPERQDEVVVCPLTDDQVSSYAEELSRARNEWLDQSTGSSHRNINLLAAIQRLRQIANGEGKMNVVFERLELLRGTRHKVLLFSEYVTMLNKVAAEMEQRGWQYDLLTGQTTRREQVISHFQETDDCQFFLISLKAGGVGINLTAADYVFMLDPWWNQAAEEQAIARAHRIGQHNPVFVYRFVAENTLEQQILTLQERKQNLIDSVMPFICKT